MLTVNDHSVTVVDMDTTDGQPKRSVSFTSGTPSAGNLSGWRQHSTESKGQKGSGSPDGNTDSMEVEDEGSDTEEGSETGSERTSDRVSPVSREHSPDVSVEREVLLRSDSLAGSGERIITTPSPRLPLRYTPEQSRQSPFSLDSVGVSGDVSVTGQDAQLVSSLRESKVMMQTSFSELRQGGAVSMEAGDTASPVTATHMLSVTRCVTRSKDVRESLSSHRVNSSGLQVIPNIVRTVIQ